MFALIPEIIFFASTPLRERRVAKVLISADQWTEILQDAAARTSKSDRFYTLVRRVCWPACRRAGIDPADAYGPEIGEALEVIDAGPECIRTADFLSLKERLWLATFQVDAPEEVVLHAKQMAVDHFRRLRVDADDPKCRDQDGLPNGSVTAVFEANVRRLLDEQRMAEADKLFADHDRLLDTVLAKLATCKSVNGSLVAGRPRR